jgi:hypothetical protein
VRPAIAVVLAFTMMAGGIALLIAVLALAFSLLWEDHRPASPAREPADDPAPPAGQAHRPAGQDGEP